MSSLQVPCMGPCDCSPRQEAKTFLSRGAAHSSVLILWGKHSLLPPVSPVTHENLSL